MLWNLQGLKLKRQVNYKDYIMAFFLCLASGADFLIQAVRELVHKRCPQSGGILCNHSIDPPSSKSY